MNRTSLAATGKTRRTSAAREKLLKDLETIPEGTVLSVWPVHSDWNCWCKPQVTWIASNTGQPFIYVLHKRLDRGEFDS